MQHYAKKCLNPCDSIRIHLNSKIRKKFLVVWSSIKSGFRMLRRCAVECELRAIDATVVRRSTSTSRRIIRPAMLLRSDAWKQLA